MMAVGDGGPQTPGSFRYRVGRRDADRVKAFGARQLLDELAQLRRLQKSSFS
jgi:hypothetical protein